MLVMCPFLYRDCVDPPLVQQPLFQCHFFLSWAFYLQLPPLVSVIPLLLPPPFWSHPPSVAVVVPPPSLLPPSPPSPTGYLRLCPQLKSKNTVSGNFYLPHSSAFLNIHCQIISSSVFF